MREVIPIMEFMKEVYILFLIYIFPRQKYFVKCSRKIKVVLLSQSLTKSLQERNKWLSSIVIYETFYKRRFFRICYIDTQ